MITIAGRNATKFGDIRYTYIVYAMNICQYISQVFVQKFSIENYPKKFFYIIIFICLTYFICLYILVGARVLFIILSSSSSLDMKDPSKNDLKEFVSLKTYLQYGKLMNRIKESLTKVNSSKNDNSSINRSKNNMDDPMGSRTYITSDISSMN